MKYYTIAFPGEEGQNVVETWSEEQILRSAWYKNWVLKVVQADRAYLLEDPQNAINDWIIIHWGYETDEWGRKIYTDCDCGCNTPVASTPESMLRFLADRMQNAGIDHAVCEIYARDIRKILEEHYEKDN